MATTIFDVAEHAGVSIGTVSRVLNNRDRVHPDTREKVLNAVRELNYQRNSLAESLAKQQTNILGLVIPLVNDPFFFEIVRGVEDAASNADYGLLIANHPRPSRPHHYGSLFRKGYIDAMILVAVDEIPEVEMKRVLQEEVPVGLIKQRMENVPSFVVDNYDGARQMALHLVGLGYKHIAYITGSDVTIDNSERLRALSDVLNEHHLTLPDEYIVAGDYLPGSGKTAMKMLLDLPHNNRPQAIFAANDQMAIDAIQTGQTWGLKIPDDIAVVGFDDILPARYIDPPLTTIAQPAYELGYQAAEYVLSCIGQSKRGHHNPLVKLPTHLVVRASCGAKKIV